MWRLHVQLINDALKRVQTERQDELNARREARQAQQAKHAAQQAERTAKHAAQQAERAAKHAATPQSKEPSRAAAQPLEGKSGQQQQQPQQQGIKRKHDQDSPVANGKAEPHALKKQQAAEEVKLSQKAGALLQDGTAVNKQERILSAGSVPDNVRLELSAQQVASAAPDVGPGKPAAIAEEARASTAGRAVKAGPPKRKRQQLDDSSDDEELAALAGVKGGRAA